MTVAEKKRPGKTSPGKTSPEKRDRGLLRVDVNECKGCGLCIEACPPKAIHLSEELNHYGYRTATYNGAGCTGCGICFMACPEPGAITVLRLRPRRSHATARRPSHAQATDEGQRSDREERDSCRLPRILWISHHAGQRNYRSRSALLAASRRSLPAGRERSGRNQHALRRIVCRRALHDRLERSRHQPHAGRHQLHGRRRAALRDRRHHARRSGPRQHRLGAERLSPGCERRRQRQLPHHRARAPLRAGDGRPDGARFRTRRSLSQSRCDARRRLRGPDDGAGRVRREQRFCRRCPSGP